MPFVKFRPANIENTGDIRRVSNSVFSVSSYILVLRYIYDYPVHIVFYGSLYSFHFSHVQCFSTYWPLPPALVYRCVIVKSLSIFTPRRIRIYRIFTGGASGSSNKIPSLSTIIKTRVTKFVIFTSRAATWSGDAVVRLQSISFPWPWYLSHHDIVTDFA